MLTTAAVLLDTLARAGVTHAFVNWGNDHPALLEELERQRVEAGDTALEIVTSPNEMVALSAAQGFAQVTGVPALVIVHVDCGTQASAPLAPICESLTACAAGARGRGAQRRQGPHARVHLRGDGAVLGPGRAQGLEERVADVAAGCALPSLPARARLTRRQTCPTRLRLCGSTCGTARRS